MSSVQFLRDLVRRMFVPAFFVLAVGLASCSGGGGAKGLLPSGISPASDSVGQPVVADASASPAASPIPLPTGITTVSGTIVFISSPRVLIQQALPHGKMWVTTSGAQSFGAPLNMGAYLEASGSRSNSGVTASSISVFPSAPAAISVQGTIVAASAYGFTLNVDAQHSAVPIVLNSSVVLAGGLLDPGDQVKIAGTGSTDVAVTPAQITVSAPTPPPAVTTPTPGPIAQKHLLTGDYLGTPWGTTSVSPAQAAPFLNWAETNVSNCAGL